MAVLISKLSSAVFQMSQICSIMKLELYGRPCRLESIFIYIHKSAISHKKLGEAAIASALSKKCFNQKEVKILNIRILTLVYSVNWHLYFISLLLM